ncbi:MAG: UvrD-helicase domain-containing protein [Myxococcales bacterium]|nr:UvrD-helicase domain-containing protein [Myxococcales bacterium]
MRLNPAQQEAVDHDLGPLLVLAGAGSGKTGVVTKRIARLIGEGTPARSILAMTFTNKAAAEMQERVTRLVGSKQSKGLLCCTFHRFGLEVLTAEGRALGLRGGRFAIFDRGDCTGIIRDALRPLVTGKSWDVGAILNRISLAKNAFIDPETYQALAEKSEDPYDELTALIYPKYNEALESLQGFDFDDLVCEPVRLFRRREDVLERWRMRFRFVIVDEYQDTNQAQLELLRLLGSEHKNVCVVGDDDQAIYAWRGADVRNILDFEKHFPGTKVVRLQHNYRSKEAVLNVANAVLESSTGERYKKHLIPTQGAGDKVKHVVARDGTTEARFVAEEIHRLLDHRGAQPKDVAVLYRSNLQAAELESELRARGIPYQMFGGNQTFERKEVKDVIAYLEAALNPSNELAVRRSLNYPARGIGDAGLKRIADHATMSDASLHDTIQRSHAVKGLNDKAREGCRDYLRILTQIRSAIDAGTPGPDVVRGLCVAIGLKEAIIAESGTNNKAAARRLANVQFLVRAFERRHEKRPLDHAGFEEFLRLLMLREQDADDGEATNKVTLTTMHGSKGLEFRIVFVVGLEEGLMPHARTLEERSTDAPPIDGRAIDEIEQERRLFYVAVTRAKEQLYLCRALGRPARGKLVKRVPSRFLLAVPEDLLELEEVMEPPRPDAAEVQRGAQDVLAALLGR